MDKLNFEFHDYSQHKEKGYVQLTPDKIVSLNFNDYPITWTGFISGSNIKILQLASSSSISDFDFEMFPEKYNHMKNEIINEIDEYISVHMD